MANKYNIMGQLTSTHGELDRPNGAAKPLHQCRWLFEILSASELGPLHET